MLQKVNYRFKFYIGCAYIYLILSRVGMHALKVVNNFR